LITLHDGVAQEVGEELPHLASITVDLRCFLSVRILKQDTHSGIHGCKWVAKIVPENANERGVAPRSPAVCH
jgi:hypothetical protein